MTTTPVAPRFALAVPPSWVRIPVDDAAASERAVRGLARGLTWSRPDHDRVRPLVTELLTDAVADRRSPSTVEVHLALGREPARPLVCALAVDLVPPRPGLDDPLAVQTAFLSTAGAGGSAEVALLAGRPVPRTVRRRSAPLPDGTALDSAVVQYLFPDSGSGFALLSFATLQLQLLAPLTGLCDAVAGSFRWLP